MKVKGNIIKARRAFVDGRFGAGAWNRVLDTLPREDQQVLRGIITNSAWFPFELGSRLDAAIVEVLGGGRTTVFEEMGRASARENLATVHQRLLEPGKPQAFLAKANIIYQFYYAIGSCSYQPTGPNSGELVTRDADTFSSVDCATVIGWYKEALEMCGARSPSVVETECRARGDAVCRYTVSWS